MKIIRLISWNAFWTNTPRISVISCKSLSYEKCVHELFTTWHVRVVKLIQFNRSIFLQYYCCSRQVTADKVLTSTWYGFDWLHRYTLSVSTAPPEAVVRDATHLPPWITAALRQPSLGASWKSNKKKTDFNLYLSYINEWSVTLTTSLGRVHVASQVANFVVERASAKTL